MVYLYTKAFHIIFVTAWFAGLFYLPRIYVNLALATQAAEYARLLTMSRKLYKFMLLPLIGTLATGLWLWLEFGISGGWLHAKLLLVLMLLGYHGYCGRLYRTFLARQNHKSHVWFRVFNEVPVFILIAVVILVMVKPF